MNTGIELITEEREEQIYKHKFDSEHDSKGFNSRGELIQAAAYLLATSGLNCEPRPSAPGVFALYPDRWGLDFRQKFERKNKIQKLVIAGALIAAEIDRLGAIQEFCPKCYSQDITYAKYLDNTCNECGWQWWQD